MKSVVKTLMGKRSASAAIEARLDQLKRKLTDNENRRSSALQALAEATAARRAVLGEDDDVVERAGLRVRNAQLEADDLAKLVDEYREAITDAEAQLEASQVGETREAAAKRLTAIADKVEALVPDLARDVAGLMKTLNAIRAALPDDVAIVPCSAFSHRPDGRPEGGDTLSPREVVAALLAEVLYGADPSSFDHHTNRFSYGRVLTKLMDPARDMPAYLASTREAKALTVADAVETLIVGRARARAADILGGQVEPVLDRIVPIKKPEPAAEPPIDEHAEEIAEALRVVG